MATRLMLYLRLRNSIEESSFKSIDYFKKPLKRKILKSRNLIKAMWND